ncbi:MAG: carbohydrate ABC transporter permease, partial [Opitutae bacterium]|nr:carbohydrate ABC transporter permease [Opitutae bacterium]
PLPRAFPAGAAPLEQEEWRDFTANTLSPIWRNGETLDTPETRWRAWLAQKRKVQSPMSQVENPSVFSLRSSSSSPPPMPQLAYHAQLFREHQAEIRRELLTRNFRTVLDYILFHGRGIVNTVVYCALAVLLALLVNPLAAYALSRFRPSAGPQILLFLMLTMAFPHMVTQIPVFVLLRELGLLNTFAALLLPGMASGYSIFLLKGFFDSLPRDLYESAQLDGAGEWTLFWQITMRLSTPILSVIALQAFSVAYANFMYALLICQDPKMWTLMVWLYQLQQRSGPGVVQASLLLAALPTLAVFLACQRVLLRGIVVPVEK